MGRFVVARVTYAILQPINQPLALAVPSQARYSILSVGARVGALPAGLRHPACLGHCVFANLPNQNPVVCRNSDECPVGAHREVVDCERRRHGDGVFRFVFGTAHVPYQDCAVFASGDQQPLVVSRFDEQRLPPEAGDSAVVSWYRAAFAKFIPDLCSGVSAPLRCAAVARTATHIKVALVARRRDQFSTPVELDEGKALIPARLDLLARHNAVLGAAERDKQVAAT